MKKTTKQAKRTQGTDAPVLPAMKRKMAYYRKRIRQTLQASGKYSPALAVNIDMAAIQYAAYEAALADVMKLDGITYSTQSREGAVRYETHPAYMRMQEAARSLAGMLTRLGLMAQSAARVPAQNGEEEDDGGQEETEIAALDPFEDLMSHAKQEDE
jgi:phage terminase small subunit